MVGVLKRNVCQYIGNIGASVDEGLLKVFGMSWVGVCSVSNTSNQSVGEPAPNTPNTESKMTMIILWRPVSVFAT